MQSFHEQLSFFLKNKDKDNATSVVLRELAVCLVKQRENFIHVLRHSGISVKDDATDLELIDMFVNNAPYNKALLLGASYMINHANKVSGFDGEYEVSDAGVKNTYGLLKSYFVGNPNADEEHSNWIGAVAGLANKLLPKKGEGGSGNKAKQEAEITRAKLEMQRKLEEQKKREAERVRRAKERAEKKSRNILIIGGVVVSILIIAVVVYASKKNKG